MSQQHPIDRVDPDPQPARAEGRGRLLPWWGRGLALVVTVLVLATVIRAFVAQAFYIPSASMEPGLVEGDRIVVQKVSGTFGAAPDRGDVVVFDDPGGWLDESAPDPGPVGSALTAIGLLPEGGHLVKRVVGVAGDTIECCDDQGRLLVNGQPVDGAGYLAPRAAGDDCDGPMIASCEWSAGPVPEGKLFVMGDNRGDSGDSSVQLCRPNETDCTRDPYVDLDEVVGEVAAIVWPLGRVGGVPDAPELAELPRTAAP